MPNFEKPTGPEPEDQENKETEVSPELKRETGNFQKNVEEITEEAEGVDFEEADEEDLEEISERTKHILYNLSVAVGAGMAVTGALLTENNLSLSWESLARGLLIGGGITMTMSQSIFPRTFNKLGAIWEKARAARLAKRQGKNRE
jgi:hypothetical protein